MKKNTIQLTQQGYDDMILQLEDLRKERQEAVKVMDHMRKLGDLKENNAYEEARKKVGFITGKIMELEEIVKDAVIIEKPMGDSVQLGTIVELHLEGDKVTYQIVDENEADIINGKISAVSPIGSALIGKAIGDHVHVESPSGTISYQILDIK